MQISDSLDLTFSIISILSIIVVGLMYWRSTSIKTNLEIQKGLIEAQTLKIASLTSEMSDLSNVNDSLLKENSVLKNLVTGHEELIKIMQGIADQEDRTVKRYAWLEEELDRVVREIKTVHTLVNDVIAREKK